MSLSCQAISGSLAAMAAGAGAGEIEGLQRGSTSAAAHLNLTLQPARLCAAIKVDPSS